MVRNINTTILTLLFLGTMFGGLFHMTMGMDMTGDMSGCPFMTHESTLCAMDVVDHVESWKSTFLATASGLVSLIVLVAVSFVFAIAPNLLLKQKWIESVISVSRNILERIFTFSYRPLQELFSNGILHPKLY